MSKSIAEREMARSRFCIAGLVCLLSVLSGLIQTEARNLLQATAPSPSVNGRYLDVIQTALQGNKLESGPILYKTFEAAYFNLLAQNGQLAQNGSQIVNFGNSSDVLVAWNNDTLALTLAFHASDQDNASLTATVSSLTPWTDLSNLFQGSPPNVNPAALNLFQAAIGNVTESSGPIFSLTGGNGSSSIGRILCTGWHGGAALAQLCGPWAQLNYPRAQVRVITFGGPRVGDAKFSYALQQFVDLPYLWMTESDNRTIGEMPSGPLQLPYVTRVISEANYSGAGERNSIEYYSTLLNNTFKGQSGSIPVLLRTNYSYGYKPRGQDSQFVLTLASEDGGFFDRVRNVAGTVADSVSAAGSAISNVVSNLFGGGDAPAPAPTPSDLSDIAGASGDTQNSSGSGTLTNENLNSCGPILCKIQPALVQACASYNDGASLGPGSITVSAEIGTDVALQWTNSTKTATFAFRGTSSSEDWRTNLRLQFSNDVSEGFFTELYNGSEIYKGELQAFRAVTDQAQSNSQNISARMLELSGGVEPNFVHCIGHSLGGGLATLCGPWAAEIWPAADIRLVTFGSPKAGNIEFAASTFATIGRAYRVVHSNDAVPSLPPFDSYIHANYAIYLPGDQVILDDRPPTEIGDLTWDAHGCDDQYGSALGDVRNITIPTWAVQMTASA